MVTVLRRCFWLAVLGGAGFAAWSLWGNSRRAAGAAPASRPAAPQPEPDRPDAAVQPAVVHAGAPDPAWVEPVDGGCPLSHPVKANANSGIFHVPGGRFYERTKPERCYRSPEAAADDGFRPAKS